MRVLYDVWLLIAAADAGASLFAAWYLFRLRERFGFYLAWVFVGIAVESICAVGSLWLFWDVERGASAGFAWMRAVGRAVKFASMLVLGLYLMGWLNGVGKAKRRTGRNDRAGSD